MAQPLEHQPTEDRPRYTLAELVEIRRQLLRYSRSRPAQSAINTARLPYRSAAFSTARGGETTISSKPRSKAASVGGLSRGHSQSAIGTRVATNVSPGACFAVPVHDAVVGVDLLISIKSKSSMPKTESCPGAFRRVLREAENLSASWLVLLEHTSVRALRHSAWVPQ
jgi:hypothetical protein